MKPLEFRSTTVFVTFVTGLFGFVLILCWGEYSNWRGQVSAVEANLERTAEAITQHMDDVVEMSRLSLASLISESVDEYGSPDLAKNVKQLITQQMTASPTLDSLSYINAAGLLVATSVAHPPSGMNYGDREYFQFHKSHPFRLAIVGKPIKSRLTQTWVIPITQKVTLEDGTFAGIVVSTVRINHFINFFRRFDVGSDGSFLLVRGDGVVLARGPVQESMFGTNISGHDLFAQHLRYQTVGAYHYKSPIDGRERAGGFYQSERTGMVVLASAAKWQVFLDWANIAKSRWIYGAVLLVAFLLVALLWNRQQRLRHANENLLASREAEFRLIAESSSDVIARLDENGVRRYVSPSATEILGVPPAALLGRSIIDGLDKETAACMTESVERLRNQPGQEKILSRHTKPDGDEIWLETALSTVPSSGPYIATSIVAISRDVTRHKVAQDELAAIAHTDELTGLANRRLFNTRFEELILNARRTSRPMTLLMVDADRFKLYNDTYGHAAGDECLRHIANTVRDCARRPGDVAARYGGEELAILLPDTDVAGAAAVSEAIRAAVEAAALPHAANMPYGHVTVSIGSASYSPQEMPVMTAQALFARADEALYLAKSSGRNRVVPA
jgi:diguanylate cyclase (GGDEF)-like protein/PAS domain S-box-containing protein